MKAKGKQKAPPPKTRVHDFQLERVLAGLESSIAALGPSPPRAVLLYLCVAMLSLVCPARPHALLSCATASVWIAGNFVLLRPSNHKRAPTDWVFRVQLPAHWLALFN